MDAGGKNDRLDFRAAAPNCLVFVLVAAATWTGHVVWVATCAIRPSMAVWSRGQGSEGGTWRGTRWWSTSSETTRTENMTRWVSPLGFDAFEVEFAVERNWRALTWTFVWVYSRGISCNRNSQKILVELSLHSWLGWSPWYVKQITFLLSTSYTTGPLKKGPLFCTNISEVRVAFPW